VRLALTSLLSVGMRNSHNIGEPRQALLDMVTKKAFQKKAPSKRGHV
jgi:hypothetical protein